MNTKQCQPKLRKLTSADRRHLKRIEEQLNLLRIRQQLEELAARSAK